MERTIKVTEVHPAPSGWEKPPLCLVTVEVTPGEFDGQITVARFDKESNTEYVYARIIGRVRLERVPLYIANNKTPYIQCGQVRIPDSLAFEVGRVCEQALSDKQEAAEIARAEAKSEGTKSKGGAR